MYRFAYSMAMAVLWEGSVSNEVVRVINPGREPTLPPRLSSLDLCDVVGEQLRVGSDSLGGLDRQISLVKTELTAGDRGKVGGKDRVEYGPVRVEPADCLERLDRGVGVGLVERKR